MIFKKYFTVNSVGRHTWRAIFPTSGRATARTMFAAERFWSSLIYNTYNYAREKTSAVRAEKKRLQIAAKHGSLESGK